MKTVGKQLQEARLARNWTPELAARETKIKVDRLRDLEADDYSHFTSPTYARGFVRTYARALGLDEYRILRQLDNKLPDDDSANIVTDSGVAYLPETAMPPRVAHRNFTGLYVVMGLGAVVALAIVFVLFEAYRVGELSRWFASSAEPVAVSGTNSAPANPVAESDNRAKPVDSSAPPPIADTTTNTPATNAPTTVVADNNDTNPPGLVSPRALPVDPSVLSASADTNAAPVQAVRALPVDPSVLSANADTNSAPIQAVRALPIDPSVLTNPAPETPVPSPSVEAVAPRALPVDPSALTNATAATPAPETLVAMNTPSPTPPPISSSARQSNSGPVIESSPPVTEPAPVVAVALVASDGATNAAPQTTAPADSESDSDKRLVLTASQDSFVRVTNLDADSEKPLYAAVLHSGESVGFDGKKFSINVGIPSAVDIKLDGVNYGPHSDQDAPETFTVQSHLP